MFQTFKNAWKTPDLRKKILFTAMVLLLYRIGACLYVPYVNVDAIRLNLDWIGGDSIFAFVSLLSGEAFSQATLFALSVSPYITASIVIQLLTIAIPALERLSKQGDEGKKKITAITRWVTIGLSLITAYGYVKVLQQYGFLLIDKSTNAAQYYFGMAVMIACFCAGAAIIMWLAEQINDHGIGNGISMILFANILSTCNSMIQGMISMVTEKEGAGMIVVGVLEVILSLALTLGAILLIVWFTNSERRIPIQYAKRVVGRKMYGGQSSNLPLKMNMAGVMPVIFASSIVSLPATIAGFVGGGFRTFVSKWLSPTSVIYIVVFIVLVFLFSYFYIAISFNPVEVANNIRSNGGSIPGIRPGKPTSDFFAKILSRITLLGALFLSVIAILPIFIGNVGGMNISIGGTSVLIMVGVALDLVQNLESQMMMRHYKGFLD